MSPAIELEAGTEFHSRGFEPWHRDRPAWIKHLRVYEYCPELAVHDANAVLADALAIGNQDSVDTVIRECGIAGCWRPSTVLVVRFVDYAANRMLVDEPTIAHALWNVDLHAPINPRTNVGFELLHDYLDGVTLVAPPRWVRVALTMVELTDAEINGDSDGPIRVRIQALEEQIRSLGASLAASMTNQHARITRIEESIQTRPRKGS